MTFQSVRPGTIRLMDIDQNSKLQRIEKSLDVGYKTSEYWLGRNMDLIN